MLPQATDQHYSRHSFLVDKLLLENINQVEFDELLKIQTEVTFPKEYYYDYKKLKHVSIS